MRRHLHLLSLVGVAACAPELEFVEWDPLDADEVQAALAEPTASIENVMEPEQVAALAGRMPLLLEHTRLAATLIDAIDEAAEPADDSDEPEPTDEQDVHVDSEQGTAFYLGLGCPGSGAEPDFNRKHGELRVDSERLDGVDPSALLDGGNVLFTFRDCQLGDVRVDGKAPVALQIDPDVVDPTGALPIERRGFAMAADLSALQVEGTALPVGIASLVCSGFGSCAEQQDIRAEVGGSDVGTAIVSFALLRGFWSNPVAVEVGVTTADGTASCEYGALDGAMDCSVDGE